MQKVYLLMAGLLASALTGCNQQPGSSPAAAHEHGHKHEHVPPHGGTAVVLGLEEYHVEFVREQATGRMQAYIMDGHLETFVRITDPSFEVVAKIGGKEEPLLFKATSNNATGEKAGDTALFEAQADWLKTIAEFDAVLKQLTIRNKKYQDVRFNFPKGNEAK